VRTVICPHSSPGPGPSPGPLDPEPRRLAVSIVVRSSRWIPPRAEPLSARGTSCGGGPEGRWPPLIIREGQFWDQGEAPSPGDAAQPAAADRWDCRLLAGVPAHQRGATPPACGPGSHRPREEVGRPARRERRGSQLSVSRATCPRRLDGRKEGRKDTVQGWSKSSRLVSLEGAGGPEGQPRRAAWAGLLRGGEAATPG